MWVSRTALLLNHLSPETDGDVGNSKHRLGGIDVTSNNKSYWGSKTDGAAALPIGDEGMERENRTAENIVEESRWVAEILGRLLGGKQV